MSCGLSKLTRVVLSITVVSCGMFYQCCLNVVLCRVVYQGGLVSCRLSLSTLSHVVLSVNVVMWSVNVVLFCAVVNVCLVVWSVIVNVVWSHAVSYCQCCLVLCGLSLFSSVVWSVDVV